MNKKKEILHIYTRVSSMGQEDGTSLETQKEKGVELSKKLGMDYKLWNEGHGSGFEDFVSTRPKFGELFECMKRGEVKHFFINDFSRLTRKDMDGYTIKSQLIKNKIVVYTQDGRYDLSVLESEMTYKVLTTFNEFQVKMSRQKCIEGFVKRVKEGKYMNTVPFGYVRENEFLKECPKNGKWVRKIFEWYSDGNSTIWIREKLFRNGVVSPRGDKYINPTTLSSWLRKTYYYGEHTYTDKESGKTFTNKNVPLIDKKLFLDVQKRLSKNRYGKNNQKKEYLLNDVVSCPCGTPMNVRSGGKGNNPELYRCRNMERKYNKKQIVSDDCVPMKSLRMEKFDEYIWETLLNTLRKSSQIKEITRKEILGKKSTYGKRSIKRKLKNLNIDKDRCDSMRLELEKEYYSGVMGKDRYDIIVGSVDEREHQLMSEITKLENELDIITQKDKWLDWIDTHLSNIDELYKIKDLKRKREVIKKYIENIEVQWGEKSRQHTIIMTMKLPLVDDGIKYKKGKKGQYLRDRKGFKRYDVVEGKKEIFTPYLHLNSFQGNRIK